MSLATIRDRRIKVYILSQIDGEGYDVTTETTEQKIKFLHDTFYAEYGWNVERIGEQSALREYFMGLPSSCNIEYRNSEILKIAKQMGELPEKATEGQENRIIDNWFNIMAAKTAQLFRGYRIPA